MSSFLLQFIHKQLSIFFFYISRKIFQLTKNFMFNHCFVSSSILINVEKATHFECIPTLFFDSLLTYYCCQLIGITLAVVIEVVCDQQEPFQCIHSH